MSESTMKIDNNGSKVWRNKAGKFHRLEGPAIERADKSKFWYKNGLLHRLDGPAVEYSDGDVIWYISGHYFGKDYRGFSLFWHRLDEEERQNVNLHMWLLKLTKS